jgi:phage-related minor tail protein
MPPWGNATVKALQFIGTEANIVFKLFQGIDLLIRNAAKRRQATLGPAPTEYDITQGADLDMEGIRLASERADRLRRLKDLAGDDDKPEKTRRGPSAEDILKRQMAAGESIAKQLRREIELRNTSNDLERELLRIKFNFEDVVANINANAAERQQQELLNLAERNRLDQENLVTIEARDKKLQEAFKMDFAALFKQDQSKLQQFISDSQKSLKDLEQVAINVSQGVGSAIANSLVNGIQGLIEGSTKVKDVFANLLKSVGQILMQEGAKMIATYIAIGIAKAFAGLSGGTKFGDMGNFDQAVPGASGFSSPSSFNATGLFGRANGGPVAGGRPYLVGEQGPELFMPRAGGAMTSNRELRQAMSQPASSMNFTFETTNIGGTEYVSREQLEAAMATTRRQAASDGAKRGMNMTLDRMQNSPRTRARVGIS